MSFILDNEYLSVRLDDVHPQAVAGVRFQRALRLPKGTPPYESVRSDAFHTPRPLNDFYDDLGFEWLLRSNQHLICLFVSESVTLEFISPNTYPLAVKVSIGHIDALSGLPNNGSLNRVPQDYIVLPTQHWIDAWQDETGATHDFVAPPPGNPDEKGVPEPRDDDRDCISVTFFPMKGDVFRRYCDDLDQNAGRQVYGQPDFAERFTETHMMRGRLNYDMQKGPAWDTGMVFPDPFDVGDWDMEKAKSVSVSMVRPKVWAALTGDTLDGPLFKRSIYEDAGVPWFDEYAETG